MSDHEEMQQVEQMVAQASCPAEDLIKDADGSLWHLTCILEAGHGGEHYGRPLSWGYDDGE